MKLSSQEVEAFMIKEVITALYPVLFPIEQQDCNIQKANHAKVEVIAKQVVKTFMKGTPDV